MRSLVALSLCIFAAACERQAIRGSESTENDTKTEVLAAAEVKVAREIGSLQGRINDIAFWAHPSLAFNSLVLAATKSGVYSFNVEDSSPVANIPGLDAVDIDIFYVGSSADARGIAAIRDRRERRFRFFAIDNISREFAELASLSPPDPGAESFCIGADRTGQHRLYALAGDAMQIYDIQAGETDIALEPVGRAEAPEGVTNCAADDLDGAVFAITQNGDVYRYTAETGFGAQFVSTGFQDATDIAVALNGLVEGGDASKCCGQLAILEGATGVVGIYDRNGGHAVGAIKIGASFDFEGVDTATALALGYANYGGVFRNGVLALAVDGEASAVKLAPFNAVMDALQVSLGPSPDPRELVPEEGDDELIIDLEPIQP